MKKISLFIIIGILFSPIVHINIDNVLADSHTYYVANNGSDSNNGLSPSEPWRTIGKVNTALNSGVITLGDDIYFKRGDTFSGELALNVGGSSSDYMIIGSYGTGARPIIENSAASENGNCIMLWSYSIGYIRIQDLQLMHTTGVKRGITITGDAYGKHFNDIIIENVYGQYLGGDFIFMMNTKNYTIESCIGNGSSIVSYGDLEQRQSNGRIFNCTVYDTSGDGFTLHRAYSTTTNDDAGSNHWFYNCTAYGCVDGYDITAGQNVILDHCRAWDCSSIGMVIDHDPINITIQNCIINNSQSSGIAVTDSSNVIVRNNKVWNTNDGSALYIASTNNSHGWADEDGYIENCTIYNNDFIYPSTFTGAYTDRVMSIGYDFIKYMFIKNNIFGSFNSVKPERLYRSYGVAVPPNGDVTFDTNIWYHGGGSATKRWDNFVSTLSLAQWQGYYPNDNFDDPEFNNVEKGDLRLNVTSPCINAGTWLTQTNGGGSGNTITVDDSSYFTDGYGMIDGDNIFVGDDTNLIITDVNYKRNQITVNRGITWTNNEYVSLSSFFGDKPDIGAIEFIQNEQKKYPLITNISLITSTPMDTDPTYGWVNVSCTVTDNIAVSQVILRIHTPSGSWNNVSMITKGSGKYYYRSATAFSTAGNYSYSIRAIDSSSNTNSSNTVLFSMPPNWDVNQDRQCNILDFVLISIHYKETGQNGWIREDINNNGEINILDFVLLSNYHGEEW